MSVLFGMRLDVDAVVQQEDMMALAASTLPWAPSGTSILTQGHVGMALQPYETHARAHLARGPVQDEHGNMLCLDGRLDNHEDLRCRLAIASPDASDAHIMLRAFVQLGIDCFAEFVGEWAVALWSSNDHTLLLARDHAGTRPLYVEERADKLRWSTYLETLVARSHSNALRDDYLNAYLSGSALGTITPYVGIDLVPAGTVMIFRNGGRQTVAHWRCYPKGTIRYREDAEYEEHLLGLLKQSVQRRTVSGAPILAQLSGGVDSSTIVCVSDLLRRSEGATSRELLDTVSFFDDTEPNWNERPFFSAVETYRGRTGEHVDVSLVRPSFERITNGRIALLPGLDAAVQTHAEQFEQRIRDRGYRVVLSGLGGDELLGGVPTPLPELSDYLVHGQWATLWHQAMAWGLISRAPIIQQLWHTLCFTAAAYGANSQTTQPPPWIRKRSSHLQTRPFPAAGRGGVSERRCHTPSEVTTAKTWEMLLATLPNPQLTLTERREFRFPYLDRELVDFALQVPNEQWVRPGRRRSLMRRALKGIVPDAVLERRRKGYLARSPMHTIAISAERMSALMSTSQLVANGLVDRRRFDASLGQAACGVKSQWAPALIRTCLLEVWLSETLSF